MTESEWLATNDPAPMLAVCTGQRVMETDERGTCRVGYKTSDRELRLFAVACCRSVWHLLTDERSRRAVEAAERFADGLATAKELHRAELDAMNAMADQEHEGDSFHAADDAACACEKQAAQAVTLVLGQPTPGNPAERAALLRDIVGNPFRPVTLPLACLTCGNVNLNGMVELGPTHPNGAWCKQCGSQKPRNVGSPALAPQVLTLARAAYSERGRRCEACKNGRVLRNLGYRGHNVTDPCPRCNGTGRIEDGTLDPLRLAVLGDALEEAGLEEVECKACGGKGETFVPLDEGGVKLGTIQDAEDGPIDVYGSGYRRCRHCKETGKVPHPVLAHLRSPGPHVRGCWAVDLVLGKE